jgi:methylmalonyl-CoA mutase
MIVLRVRTMSKNHPDTQEKQGLFSEFSAPTKEEWLNVVSGDLKDTPFEKLVWKSLEGIDIQPMYFKEDLEKIQHSDFLPGEAPYVRGNTSAGYRARANTISQDISFADVSRAREAMLLGMKRGMTGAELHIAVDNSNADGISVLDEADFLTLLQDIDLNAVELHIHAGAAAPVFLALLEEAARKKGVDPASIRGSVSFAPLSALVSDGSIPISPEKQDIVQAEMLKFAKSKLPGVKTIGIDSSPVHNAGASSVQELACSLAMAVEYMDCLTKKGVSIDDIASAMRFSFPVGPTFFTEIAKLRAARMLWAKVVQAWSADKNESMQMDIHARSSSFFASKYDPYVNMLRGTVETMAAMLGGADAVTVRPFNAELGMPGDFAMRIATNTQIVLQDEAHIAKLADPAGGSFYVESITESLAQESWKLFQEIESEGGFSQALRKGVIQKMVSETAKKRKHRVSTRKRSLIGTNVYPNLTEEAIVMEGPSADEIAADKKQRIAAKEKAMTEHASIALRELGESSAENLLPAIGKALNAAALIDDIQEILSGSSGNTEVEAMKGFRLADTFEILRDAVEAASAKPVVFLATYGPVNWRRARATFAAGFLGCAGMDIRDNLGFGSPEEIVVAAKDAKTDILVLCSDDESYESLAQTVVPELKAWKEDLITIVAGNPANKEALSALGVDDFVHVKSDAGVMLAELLETLGYDLQDGGLK